MCKTCRSAAIGFLAGTSIIGSASAALYDSPVHIKSGSVQGFQALNRTTTSNLADWENITAWLGIPFAASTTGDNRWKAPQPATPWNTTLQAYSFGPGCPQGSLAAKKTKRDTTSTTSEDCLSVNIWSPATSTHEKLPVAVWSYGAGATSSDTQYDGAGLASKGIVMVTYNYRTGPFGWLTLPELAAENPHNVSGNYGLLDQIEVLKWVKHNIASFGGDPDHITTVGQSFGSGAVLHTLNSPLAKGLIVGAIAESGIKDPYDPELSGYGSDYNTMDVLIPFSETYQSSLNVSTVAELRSLSTDELLLGTGVSLFTGGFDPVLDGWAIPSTYLHSLENGPANDVPVLVGNNRDEDGITFSENYTVAEYHTAAVTRYNATWAEVFETLYPANTTAKATTAYDAQLRDQMRTSTWSWASRWAKKAVSPVYTYLWDHAPPGQTSGAFHASEIPYVLNTLYADQGSPWAADDYAIAEVMSAYWANFIKHGNPNVGHGLTNGTLTHWPESRGSKETTFNVGDSFEVVPLGSKAQVEAILGWFKNATTTPF